MADLTTRRALRIAAAKSLSAYFTAVLSAATANPHTTLTVPQIADVAFDAERFQFWFVRRSSPATVAITSSSAADPTTVTTAAHLLSPGDTVTISGHTNAALNGTFVVLTVPSTTSFTVDVATAYAGGTGGTVAITQQFRIISSTGLPTLATITLTRAFQSQNTVMAAGEALDFYLILSPDEWDNACDAALEDKFYKDRISIALVAGQTEYDLTDNTEAFYSPWFQSKGQFIRGRFRDSGTAGAPVETEIPVTYFVETGYGVKLILPTSVVPADVTVTTAEIEARHYYPAFTSDTATITLPFRLAVKAVQYEALKLIFQKLGPAAKKVYGMQMALAEKDLTEQEARWLDNSARRDLSDDEVPTGGDMERGLEWGW